MKKSNTLIETTVSSVELVDGVLIKARRDVVRLPDGNESVREWIDHPGASAVVPLFDDGSTLLVRQFRYPPKREFLEVPAGKIDIAGESPEDVARRELEEETGWRAGRLESLGSLYPCIGYSNEIIHFYVAHDLQPGTRALSEGEFMENVRMPFTEAVSEAKAGKIIDMKSAVALMMAAARLELGRIE
ncbi:MAG: NUDIX hydrolase [Rhodothermales bacterium]|nr:NUDIX hydrolase [Rhodothermales bacterium]